MKAKLIAILLTASISTSACAQSPEQTKGAIIGGALGTWLGNGGGHQKEAAVAGIAAGYLLGNTLFGGNSGTYYTRQPYSYNDFRRECDNRIPLHYRGNHGAARAWSNGCVNRLQQEQQALEHEAYNSGAYSN